MTTKEYNKQYYHANKDKFKEYNQKPEVKERSRGYAKKYYNKNTDKCKIAAKKNIRKRLDTDPKYRLISNLRTRLHHLLGGRRSHHTLEVLGCSLEEFKHHLERQFEPWMTWENMGGRHVSGPNITWDLDHIVPISSAQTEEDVYRLSHYTNLRPLCSFNNRWVKRNTYLT
jgi:hypothetical protein